MTPNVQLKAAIYTRISFDRTGEGLGVERQLADCEALAERLRWKVVARFDDNDLSAMTGKTRPGFEDLLDAIKRGEVDGVLCWQPDRLYRRVSDLSRLLDLPRGVEIRTVNGGDLDLSNSTGRMLATILGSVATQESELKAERQRRAAQQLAESGKPKWKRAFGYLSDTRSKKEDDGTRQLDPATAHLVKDAYNDLLNGATLQEIADTFNDSGAYGLNGKPWTPSTVSLFLRNPRNAGLRSYEGEIVRDKKGKPVKATWPALVDPMTWQTAQAILKAPGRAPGRKTVRRHKLTGLLLCGRCGHHLSGLQTIDKKRIAYRCKACLGVSIRAEHVEPFLLKVVSARLARPDAVDLLRAEVHDTAEAEELRAEKTVLYERLNQFAIERAKGEMTGAQVRTATEYVQAQIDAIEAQERDQEKLRLFDQIPLGKPQVKAAIESLSPDRLRAVVSILAKITVMPVGKGGHVFRPDRVQVDWL